MLLPRDVSVRSHGASPPIPSAEARKQVGLGRQREQEAGKLTGICLYGHKKSLGGLWKGHRSALVSAPRPEEAEDRRGQLLEVKGPQALRERPAASERRGGGALGGPLPWLQSNQVLSAKLNHVKLRAECSDPCGNGACYLIRYVRRACRGRCPTPSVASSDAHQCSVTPGKRTFDTGLVAFESQALRP